MIAPPARLAFLGLAAAFAACDSQSRPASQSPPPSPAPALQAQATDASAAGADLSNEPPTSRVDGFATWYDVPDGSLPERRAPGEFTAAYDRLPLGTYVRVTDKASGRAVIVCVTDRGVSKRRVIDLCKEAAEDLGLIGKGEVKVLIEALRARKELAKPK